MMHSARLPRLTPARAYLAPARPFSSHSSLLHTTAPSRKLGSSHRPSPPSRQLHTSPTRHASPPPPWQFSPEVINALRTSTVFQTLKDKPEALAAMARFAAVLEESSPGTTLSGSFTDFRSMAKMLLNKDVRDALRDLAQAFQTAGLDLTDTKLMQELQDLAALAKKAADENAGRKNGEGAKE